MAFKVLFCSEFPDIPEKQKKISNRSRNPTTLFYYQNFIQSSNNNKIHEQLFTGVLQNRRFKKFTGKHQCRGQVLI